MKEPAALGSTLSSACFTVTEAGVTLAFSSSVKVSVTVYSYAPASSMGPTVCAAPATVKSPVALVQLSLETV